MKKVISSKTPTLSRSLQKRIKKLEPDFSLDSESKLTLTKNFESYLEGFMFICRVVVHSEVLHKSPSITLKKNTVKISIESPHKTILTEEDVYLAERLNQLLST